MVIFRNNIINLSNVIKNTHASNKTSLLKPLEDLPAKSNNNLLHDIGYISENAKL